MYICIFIAPSAVKIPDRGTKLYQITNESLLLLPESLCTFSSKIDRSDYDYNSVDFHGMRLAVFYHI
jgi:hypothetical protein